MNLTSLQVCVDSADWLQGTIHDGAGMDASSSPSEDILTCSRPLIERRLRPPHDQPQKCPRCESTHTKFCYYNNYSLSQPRYFCKSCRRYWTKGGTLRNIPVGGGCRKNKKVSSKKSSNADHNHHQPLNQKPGNSPSSSSINPTDLHLSHPQDMQFPHHLMTNFMDTKYSNFMLENPAPPPIDFMENNQLGLTNNSNDLDVNSNFPGLCSPSFGLFHNNPIIDHQANTNYDRLMMLPYEDNHQEEQINCSSLVDVKPNPRFLSSSMEANCADDHATSSGKDTFGGYNLGGLGSTSWTLLMNGFGNSGTNPLV